MHAKDRKRGSVISSQGVCKVVLTAGFNASSEVPISQYLLLSKLTVASSDALKQ